LFETDHNTPFQVYRLTLNGANVTPYLRNYHGHYVWVVDGGE